MTTRRALFKASRIHLALSVVWAALAYPTITIWHNSVLWVGLISVYANVATHLGAWEAAKAKEITQDVDLQTDHPPQKMR